MAYSLIILPVLRSDTGESIDSATSSLKPVVNGPDDEDDDDGGGGGSNPSAGVSDDGGGVSGTSGEGENQGSNNANAAYTNDADTGGDSSGSDLYGGADAPGLASGGLTRGEELAYLHPSEVIIGVESGTKALAEEMDGADGGEQVVIEEINVDADGDMSENELIRAVRREFDRELSRLSTR